MQNLWTAKAPALQLVVIPAPAPQATVSVAPAPQVTLSIAPAPAPHTFKIIGTRSYDAIFNTWFSQWYSSVVAYCYRKVI